MLVILFLFFIFGNVSLYSSVKEKVSYGLTFNSHDVNKDSRTSLDLNPLGDLLLEPGNTLDFDLKLEKANLTYGYVFRLILNDTLGIDLLSHLNFERINLVISSKHDVLSNIT